MVMKMLEQMRRTIVHMVNILMQPAAARYAQERNERIG
jgi:hypothetical protein